MDEMREKQLIAEKENNAKQVKVPFFIPIKDGLRPRLHAEPIKEDILQRDLDLKVANRIQNLDLSTPLTRALVKCASTNQFTAISKELKELNPSATDAAWTIKQRMFNYIFS